MIEYLNKQAVLEWLKKQQKKQEENRDRLEIDHQYWEYHEGASDYLSLAVEEFESGAFDADESEGTWKATAEVLGRENTQMNSEIQRLRAALEQFGWRLERTSCACGGEWAWLRRRESGAWEMYGCACHHLPATEQAERVKGITEVYVVRNRNKDILYVGLDWNEVEELLAQDASYEYLSYGINAPEKVGTEEWRHKYFGAEWPKAEGDENA